MDELKELSSKLDPQTDKIKEILNAANVGTLVETLEQQTKSWESKLQEINKQFVMIEKSVERLRVDLDKVFAQESKADELEMDLRQLIDQTNANIQALKEVKSQ